MKYELTEIDWYIVIPNRRLLSVTKNNMSKRKLAWGCWINSTEVMTKKKIGSRLKIRNFKNTDSKLTLYFTMSLNGQTPFKNFAAFPARFLKCVRSFYDIAK